MNVWEEKVRSKLAKDLDVETSFDQIRQEWHFTGNYKEHGSPNATCELCGNKGLRHHYLIAHKQTGEALWVGSQCILNFDESIYGEVKKFVAQNKKKNKYKQMGNF
ncbi:MAG: hypothetical protein HON98_05650 [Chloroflexi bacterium]|jgi:hypothetical protein|nr:hypothetical protein [Chloroflexota bacterium]MBT3670121.1 hypothetical protein [Chloroflexota bacterium]MBT4003966.1 hypothetical protein [Chloroflexota bacterium]MBT4306677.1 hypothetical protein [Chloroflexota bacterium]MBT4533007.1 hypothetical protein [Chloroflexota bacterium]